MHKMKKTSFFSFSSMTLHFQVVKVFTSSVPPSFKTPWTNKVPLEFTGTGFVFDVDKKLILTNAHCVEYARTILLRKEGDHEKFEASLLAISVQVRYTVYIYIRLNAIN